MPAAVRLSAAFVLFYDVGFFSYNRYVRTRGTYTLFAQSRPQERTWTYDVSSRTRNSFFDA